MSATAISMDGFRSARRPAPSLARPRPAPARRMVARPVVARQEPALHLTARGRLVVALLGLTLVAVPVAVGTSAARADAPSQAQQVERHIVSPGETLWRIAAGVARPGEDVRDVVAELVRLNALPDAGLVAGQTIVVPVRD